MTLASCATALAVALLAGASQGGTDPGPAPAATAPAAATAARRLGSTTRLTKAADTRKNARPSEPNVMSLP